MLLDGKVAIVTGSAQGIGKAYAKRLAAEGARVVVADIAFAQAEETAAEIRASGGEAMAVNVDATDEVSTAALARDTVDRYGALDILVNNAALFVAIFPKKPFTEITVEEWDRVMAVNVRGVFLASDLSDFMTGQTINVDGGYAFH